MKLIRPWRRDFADTFFFVFGLLSKNFRKTALQIIFVAIRWLRHRSFLSGVARIVRLAQKRHGPRHSFRHTALSTFFFLPPFKRKHTLMASTFTLRRLPVSCRSTLLSRANPLPFRPLSLRPAVALYSTRPIDQIQESKPYYITTPIFYVNAGTRQQQHRLSIQTVLACDLLTSLDV